MPVYKQFIVNTIDPFSGRPLSGMTAFFCFAMALASALPAHAEEAASLEKLASLSVSDLMDVTITTSKKMEEPAFDAASSVYVLSGEAIRRSGATNIPEALRLVPGLNVSRVDLNNYMVSGTVNNDYFTDKLLALIDGRPVQSRTWSLVWWPAQMYPLEDVERIEVIRGAGSALWGSNAMAGVINIITKNAKDTKGGFVSAGGGKIDRQFGSARYGASSDALSYRVYAMAESADGARFVSGERGPNPRDSGPQNNKMDRGQAGFRLDWEAGGAKATLHGDVYSVKAFTEGAMFIRPMLATKHFIHEDKYDGQNLSGSYENRISDALTAKLRLIYEKTGVRRAMFAEDVTSMDAEAQADYAISGSQTLTIGASYTSFDHAFTGSTAVSMPNGKGYIQSLFAQDEVLLMDNRLKLLLGAKAEKNNLANWESQPNLKAAWLGGGWTLWGSAARSARLPNRMNADMMWVVDSVRNFPNPDDEFQGPGLLGVVTNKGNPAPEVVDSLEAGFRLKSSQALVWDLALFRNTYTDAIALFEEDTQKQQPGKWAPYDPFVYDIYYRNMFDGEAYGGTLSFTAKPAFWASFSAGYTYTSNKMNLKEGIPKNRKHSYSEYLRGSTPEHTVKSALRLDLPWRSAMDIIAIYTDPMKALNVRNNIRLDIRLAYNPTERLEVSVAGRNLLKERQMEWYSPWTYDNAWVQRDFVARVDYRF